MQIELEKEHRKLTLQHPLTELVIPPIEFPITLTSKISDEKGSLWDIEVSDIVFDSRHKKEPSVNVQGRIIVYKDKKRIVKREGHLFTCNNYSKFWNSYLSYPNFYDGLLSSKVYRKGDKKRLQTVLNPANSRIIDIALSIIEVMKVIKLQKKY